MGLFEAGPLGSVERPVKYHPYSTEVLTEVPYRDPGHCQAGSLTGAVASQSVTEAREGSLSLFGNQATSAKAEGSLTVRPTSRADAKAGFSDPVVLYGRAIAQRIKGTPGITG